MQYHIDHVYMGKFAFNPKMTVSILPPAHALQIVPVYLQEI